MNKFLIPFFLAFFISSCADSTKPQELAEKTCECLQDATGIEGLPDLLTMSDRGVRQKDIENSLLLCMGEELKAELSDMSHQARVDFLREYLKSLLDTDCADLALGLIARDEIIHSFL